jgi:predicted SAM-dependent methyltransferase
MKLNVGCWKRDLPGFINIDLIELPHIDFKTDIGDLNMFDDDSADLIYCSHALEYKTLVEVNTTLKEWWRVLKPGGILRLSVPNFQALVEIYNLCGDIRNIQGPIFGFMQINDHTINHKVLYDYHLLERVLKDAGFKNIGLYDWKSTEHADVDDHSQAYYPHMDKDNGILVSLNMQCNK